MDFGCADNVEALVEARGTPHYMAPEMLVLSGYRKTFKDATVQISPSFDLWSLAIMWIEIVSGEKAPIDVYIKSLGDVGLKNGEIVLDGNANFVGLNVQSFLSTLTVFSPTNPMKATYQQQKCSLNPSQVAMLTLLLQDFGAQLRPSFAGSKVCSVSMFFR